MVSVAEVAAEVVVVVVVVVGRTATSGSNTIIPPVPDPKVRLFTTGTSAAVAGVHVARAGQPVGRLAGTNLGVEPLPRRSTRPCLRSKRP